MAARNRFRKHDQALRSWFAARGWPVTETFDCAELAMHAWNHSGADGQHTLYVTDEVLTSTRGSNLPALLDERFADTALREMPDGQALLCYRRGLLVLSYIDGREARPITCVSRTDDV
jgi:hypothetical protein